MSFTKTPAPERAEFSDDYAAMSDRAMQRKYGVSGSVIARWAAEFKLPRRDSYFRSALHTIPLEVFGPIFDRLWDSYPICASPTNQKKKTRDADEEMNGIGKAEQLGSLIGVSGRRLMLIRNREVHSISFEAADRITSFFCVNHLWLVPPLCEHYAPPGAERAEDFSNIVAMLS